jgi:hypothetical protein
MRLAVRRTVGVIGATGVAIGAAMVLALPASAHSPVINAYCDQDTGITTVTISLDDYNPSPAKSNWATLDDSVTGSLLAKTDFSKTLPDGTKTTYTVDGHVAHTFTMTVFAHDDVNPTQHGNGAAQQWDGTFVKQTDACVKTSESPTPTPTPTPTPSNTPTHSSTPPAPSPTTTSEAVVAAASTTSAPGAGSLPFTGVNTALPLGIAGLLVVAGGGILFWLRFNARRRHSS